MNGSSIEKNRQAHRKSLSDPARFEWTMEEMSRKQPDFARELNDAIDRGEQGLISEENLYRLYDKERDWTDDLLDFIDMAPQALATAIYESNPEFYDEKGRPSRQEDFPWLGVAGGLGSVILSGAAMTPKFSPVTAGIAGALVATGGILTAAGAMGELAMPEKDRIDDALVAGFDSLFAKPWEKKRFIDLMPESPNLAMALEWAAPDLAFDVALPAVAGKMFRGAKAQSAPVEKVDGMGPEEIKYKSETALRQSKINRFDRGEGLVGEYLKLEKGGVQSSSRASRLDELADIVHQQNEAFDELDPIFREEGGSAPSDIFEYGRPGANAKESIDRFTSMKGDNAYALHHTRKSSKGFSVKKSVKDRYDGDGGELGGDGLYLDMDATWTRDKNLGYWSADHAVGIKTNFKNPLVITSEKQLAKIARALEKAGVPKTTDGKLYYGPDLAKYAKDSGHDGLVLRGFNEKELKYRETGPIKKGDWIDEEYGADYDEYFSKETGFTGDIAQDQGLAFYPERLEVVRGKKAKGKSLVRGKVGGKEAKLLEVKDMVEDINAMSSGNTKGLSGQRKQVVQDWIDLYKGAPEDEVDAAYAVGKKLPKRPISSDDIEEYRQRAGSGGGRMISDVMRYTDSVFGPDSTFRKKFVDPVLKGVYHALEETSRKRGEFEALAMNAGLHKLSITRAGRKLATRATKQGQDLNKKMYDAVESGNITDLDDTERELYYWINNFYEEALFESNKILRSLGKKEIGTSYITKLNGMKVRTPGNYLPRIWALNYADEIWDGLANIPDSVLSNIDKVVGETENLDEVGEALTEMTGRYKQSKWVGGRWMPFSSFAQRRMGVKEDYLRDVIETFDQYNSTINRIKHASAPAETTFRAVDQLEQTHMIDPTVAGYYKDWLSSGVLHKRASIDKILFPEKRPLAFKVIETMVHNMSRNLLAGSLQFFMTNIASFPQYVAMAGLKDTTRALWRSKGELIQGLPGMMRGMGAAASEAGQSFARENSKVLQMREFTGYENMGREIMKKGNILTAWEKIIESADQFNVAWGFNTGYIKGKKLGLADDEAIRYADDVAMRTQAVYDRAFISPILKNRVIQTAIPFQTFTTNLYQWFRRDILNGGIPLRKGAEEGDPLRGLSPAGKMGVAVRFLGMAYAINMTYKSLGLSPPWDLTSVIPFAPGVAAVTGEAIDEPYGAKTLQLTFLDPVKKLWTGINAEHYDLMDPEFRKGLEGMLMLQPYGFGLQANKTLTGLMDLAAGGTVTPTGTGKTRFGRFEDATDELRSVLFGPRKTEAYRKIRGEFEPQPSGLQAVGGLLFPDDWPPYQDE